MILQRAGRDVVTVKRQERGTKGQLRANDVEVFRNRWVIEKEDFCEQRAGAAQLVQDAIVEHREAVRQRPELAGT